MNKIVLCGGTGWICTHYNQLFLNTEEIEYVEMIGMQNNDESPNIKELIKLEEFDVSEDNLYLFLLFYEDIRINDIVFDEFHNLTKIFTFQYMNIGGIPLAYLNSQYPINYYQYQIL